jgi:hypothetical protein
MVSVGAGGCPSIAWSPSQFSARRPKHIVWRFINETAVNNFKELQAKGV